MYIEKPTTDNLLREVFSSLINESISVTATRGDTREIFGVLLKLENPRARLSRTEIKGTPFSALGELLWYLSRKNDLDFIKYYIKQYENESHDGQTIYGAYGPRLFNMDGVNQIDAILNILNKKQTSRRAVIQLFTAKDLDPNLKEVPCTCTLQFAIRNNELNMMTHMRSNDAFFGLPHDIYTFTMLQEILAKELDVELGFYKHSVGSLHVYDTIEKPDGTKINISEKIHEYIGEAYQSHTAMTEMPSAPLQSIKKLLHIEENLRVRDEFDENLTKSLDPYWQDLAYMLQVYNLRKKNKPDEIEKIKTKITNKNVYSIFIEDTIRVLKQKAAP